MPVPNAFHRYQKELEEELRSVLSKSSSPLYAMMHHHFGWADKGEQDQYGSGKRARPTLCLLACEMVGGDWQTALPAAAAIELIHNFSLIHDDIQDKSKERRNRPTVWKIWGAAQGINAGDAMYALAQLTLLKLEGKGVSQEKMMNLSRELNQASLQLCEGQYLDIEYERHLNIDIDDYLDMIDKKTASLFGASTCFGALLGTDNQAKILSLSSFGKSLGMAFQIQNDLHGIQGERENGKPSARTDVRYKKKTFPIIYALQKAENKEREGLTNIYKKARVSDEDIAEVLRILNMTGAKEYTEHMRKKYYLQSLKDLEAAKLPPPAQQELKEVAAYLLGQP